MTSVGARDPQRNRQYYEDRHLLSSERSMATARLTNTSDSTLVSPSGSISDDENELATAQKSAPVTVPTTLGRLPVRIKVTHASPRNTEGSATDFGRFVEAAWNDLKEMLGFRLTCLNGGTRTSRATCLCPKLFEGANCAKRICLNGGRLEKAKYAPVSWDCKCPTPQYIEGAHCETVRCANNAQLRTETNGSWWCDCSDSLFYSGRFCEEFTAPYAMFAIPLACLLLFALCIAVCQMDLCPRRRRPSRHMQRLSDSGQGHAASRSRRRAASCAQTRPPGNLAAGQRTAVTQELLIAEDRGLCRRAVAYPQGIVAPYVIRLDTIPHFNPHMIGGVDPMTPAKPLDPPPSYEQAVTAPAVSQPPSYTERADEGSPPLLPPPPSRQPPLPPSSS